MKLSTMLKLALLLASLLLSSCMSANQANVAVPQTQGDSAMISRDEAVRIATDAAKAAGFDVEHLEPDAQAVAGNWQVQLRRKQTDPPTLGGDFRVVIEGKTGNVLESVGTQ
jgi:ABC-type amino acid transport substrate-binding protein